jgi:hypothetical protein
MRLGPGSAAIGQVPAAGANCPATDQRGVARPGGASCDIGAYEVAGPTVTTLGATGIGQTSATLRGTLFPNQATATFYFQFGTTTGYGDQTVVQTFGGISPVPAVAMLSGLRPGATYHYRLVATSVDGMATGADQTFTTSAPPPPVIRGLKVRALRVSYTDSAAGTTRFVLARCVKFSRHGCLRFRRVRRFVHHDQAGHNRFLLASAGLKPGRYRLTATPVALGQSGPTISAAFTITAQLL